MSAQMPAFPERGTHPMRSTLNRNMLLRLADTFFRRWFLYLIPFVLLAGVGGFTAARSESRFRSEGVMYVESQTLLANLTQARDTPASYKSPSTLAAEQLGSLMRTDGFMKRIVKAAKVDDAVKSGLVTIGELRSSISVGADGDHLVKVAASSTHSQTAALLVTSTIETFTSWVIEANVAESTAAKLFLDTLVDSYRTQVSTAHQTLDAFVSTNPEADVAKRSLANQIEFERLTAASNVEEARLAAAINKREDARLATEQTKSDVTQRLRLVDAPEVSALPVSSRKQAALAAVIFAMLGLLLTAGATLGATAADRSIRFASDITDRLGVPVLSIIPQARARDLR